MKKYENEMLVSVVVPVYNVQNYLVKCIESLLCQTYPDIEIILVDDGSTDESGILCDRYERKYENVIVIHQENRGLSGARNTGIEIARGRYITFIDSDDYVSNNYIEYLFFLLQSENADMSICSNYKFYEDNKFNFDTNKNVVVKQFTALEALENMLYRKNITAYACGKLCKIELFQDIRFPERQLFEDLYTTYKVIDQCKKIVWSSAQNYFYLQRKDSIVNSNFDVRKLSVVDACIEILDYVERKYPEIQAAAISKLFVSAADMYRRIPDEEIYRMETIRLKEIILKYRKIVLLDKDNKVLVRGIAFAACVNINILRTICRLYTVLCDKYHIRFRNPI